MKKEAVDKLVECLTLACAGRNFSLFNRIRELKKLLTDDDVSDKIVTTDGNLVNDGWIKHDYEKGVMPVDSNTLVIVKLLDGSGGGMPAPAHNFIWHYRNGSSITHYKAAEPNGSNMRLYNPKTHYVVPRDVTVEQAWNFFNIFKSSYGYRDGLKQAIEEVFGGE